MAAPGGGPLDQTTNPKPGGDDIPTIEWDIVDGGLVITAIGGVGDTDIFTGFDLSLPSWNLESVTIGFNDGTNSAWTTFDVREIGAYQSFAHTFDNGVEASFTIGMTEHSTSFSVGVGFDF